MFELQGTIALPAQMRRGSARRWHRRVAQFATATQAEQVVRVSASLCCFCLCWSHESRSFVVCVDFCWSSSFALFSSETGRSQNFWRIFVSSLIFFKKLKALDYFFFFFIFIFIFHLISFLFIQFLFLIFRNQKIETRSPHTTNINPSNVTFRLPHCASPLVVPSHLCRASVGHVHTRLARNTAATLRQSRAGRVARYRYVPDCTTSLYSSLFFLFLSLLFLSSFSL